MTASAPASSSLPTSGVGRGGFLLPVRYRRLLLLLVAVLSVSPGLQLQRLTQLPEGPYGYAGSIVLMDSDHDSLGEVIFGAFPPPRLPIWEYRPVNGYELTQSDTGMNHPDSLYLGNFVPAAAGDIDRDGKADLVGWVGFGVGGRAYVAPALIESGDTTRHPDDFIWRGESSSTGTVSVRFYADLDQDSARELVMPGTRVYENIGDNEMELVFCGYPPKPKVCGDYDQNGRMDFASRRVSQVYVSECTGDNQYAVVCSVRTGLPNPTDYFTGSDADFNGRPEFFVTYDRMGGMLFLVQFEAVAEHRYEFYVLDSFRLTNGEAADQKGLCADLDGDGVEEVIWSCVSHVIVLKALLPHFYTRVSEWRNDHQVQYPVSFCNAADFNRNGYNELYIGGNNRVSVLEVEAITLWAPRGGESLNPGDTCRVRWRVLTPPRCDSVSLFFLTDTVVPQGEWFWRMDTIVTGLSPGDSTYPWVVPDTVLDAAWIVAITYGPGWQFDRSDGAFRIVPSGVVEEDEGGGMKAEPVIPTLVGNVLLMPKTPIQHSSFALLNSLGRKVMDLQPGDNDIRHLAPGVYFVRQASSVEREASSVRKVVLAR